MRVVLVDTDNGRGSAAAVEIREGGRQPTLWAPTYSDVASIASEAAVPRRVQFVTKSTTPRDHSLWDCFVRNAGLHPAKPAFTFENCSLTHADLAYRARRYAAGLSDSGIGRGDRVAVLCDGRPEYFCLLAAAACLGAILVPLNWRLNPAEVGRMLSDSKPTLVFAEPQYLHFTEGRSEPLVILPSDDSVGEEFVARFEAAAPLERDPDIQAGLPLLILYTAAHDGEPRGAVISQANLLASSVQMHLALAFDEDDVFLGNLPFFHMMALALALGVNFAGGCTVVRPRFDAAESAALIEAAAITLIGTFPPMLSSLLDERDAKARDFSSLRSCMGLDAAPTIERFEATCVGATFWSIYGQTETTGNVAYGRWRDRPGAAGRAASMTTLAILDPADHLVPDGEIGEIGVRGPTVFEGYWGRETENAFVLRNGWHHTGDLGCLRDGWLHYHARAPHKQLIKTGGENVYPAEVEFVLESHPLVRRAVVIGIPDQRWGESVVAVCEAGEPIEIGELRQFVAARLARYKRPRYFEIVSSLPSLQAGQVDREKIVSMVNSKSW